MELEDETRNRARAREAFVPMKKKEIPLSQGEVERRARVRAEAIEAWEESMAEATNKPPQDYAAIEAAEFRESWIKLWSDSYGDFDETTKIPPMNFTDKIAPPSTAMRFKTLQIFSVKVTKVSGALQWPLHIFGTISLRDGIDHRCNLIFNLKRENYQTLTEKKPYLALSGPTRAVVMMPPVTFEVELKVRGNTESEDEDLSYLVEPIQYAMPLDSCSLLRNCTSRLSTLELSLGHICRSVEATISVQVVGGTWHGYRSEFFACTESINEEVVLLDSGDEEVLLLVMARSNC